MKCDICGQDLDNSKALQAHIEQMHPAGVSDKSIGDLEAPAHVGDTPEESAAVEIPLVTH
jgi:hypothetical protein